jgi:beta-mannosidase
MVRVMGTTVYEDRTFWDTCDELGLLVWQDAMLTSLDPPEDPVWLADLHAELVEVLEPLAGRPSLAVVCGGSETEQQPAMLGLDVATLPIPAITDVVPAAVAQVVPGTPYVTSSPSGGVLPFHVGAGVAQYFGVGGYRRPPEDVRTAGVRFAAECLALACPPEQTSLTGWFDLEESAVRGHAWREGVARDAGADWDFEDVVDHYVRICRPRSGPCDGRPGPRLDAAHAPALVGEVMGGGGAPRWLPAWCLRDLCPERAGAARRRRPAQAPWWVLRRTMAPRPHCHRPGPRRPRGRARERHCHAARGTRRCARLADGATTCAPSTRSTPARASTSVLLDAVLGFRDLAYVYRFFGPRIYDAVAVTWCDDTAETLGGRHLVGGLRPPRPRPRACRRGAGTPTAGLGCQRPGWSVVVVDLPGWRAGLWFTLLPGQTHRAAASGRGAYGITGADRRGQDGRVRIA